MGDGMDWSQFHFLRPLWLLALIPAIWLWWRLRQRFSPQGRWAEAIDARFLKRFLARRQIARPPTGGLLLLWTLTIVALSGPTWRQRPVEARPPSSGSVIVLDLSASMLAQDIQPSRLQRARYKLQDLLRRHPERRFGLVVYAATAHVVMPISRDTATLKNLLPALSPHIMPYPGSRPEKAMRQAWTLLQGAGVERGHIIWVTDDLDQAEALRRFFARHPELSLAILAVGTADGAPIPQPDGRFLRDDEGRHIVARTPWQALRDFARAVDATLTPLTLDDRDIERIAPPFAAMAQTRQNAKPVYQWQDMGPWLAVLTIVLAAGAFRRGWIFAFLAIVPLTQNLFIPPALANEKTLSDWHDLFRTPDQQGYRQWLAEHYGRACDLFERPDWKGAACYRAGRLEIAERAWRRLETPEAFYNLGNLYVRQRKWKRALSAYREALRRRPDFPQARDNLHRLESFLAQRQIAPGTERGRSRADAPSASPPVQAAAHAALSPTHEEKRFRSAPLPSGKPPPSGSPAKPVENRPAAGDARSSARPAATSGAPRTEPDEAKRPPALREPLRASTQTRAKAARPPMSRPRDADGLNDWLRQIPDNPAAFLQRKFRYQSERRPVPHTEEKTW